MKLNKGANNPVRIFKYFSGIVTLVFGLLFILSGLRVDTNTHLTRSYLHFVITYSVIFFYLTIPGLPERMKKWYLPPVLIAASVIPFTIINVKFRGLLSSGASVNIMEDSMTITFLLLFPLIITSWNYSFPIVFLFYVILGFLDPLLIFLTKDGGSFVDYSALTASMLRITALTALGFMITELREMQRRENSQLEEANRQLEDYAHNNERLAVSRERNRIARELHDTLAHTLSGLSIQLGAAETLIHPENTQLKNIMDKSLKTVREGLNETRRALKAMRASPLEEFGFTEAVKRLTDNAHVRDNLDINLTIPDPLPDLEPELEECLYRIIQESLENIIRHARASKVTLTLNCTETSLNLSIADDGHGFDISQKLDGRFGLRGLKERAANVGGSLEILSSKNNGTSIHFHREDNE